MEDQRIIELLWRRDETALRELDARYGPICLGLANHLLGSGEDAEECWNDALLRLWNAVPPERPTHLRAYLVRLTRGLAIDRLRAARAEKRGGGEFPLLLDELSECVSGGESPEDEALSRAMGEAIGAYLRTRPPRDRALFVGRYVYGEPLETLARRYGMRKNTVSVTLRRCRAGLRDYLEQEGFTV